MFVPPHELYQRMLVEHAGIWFAPSEGDDTVAIVLKARSNILKAIKLGCNVMVHFGIDGTSDDRVLVSCLQVFDEDESPTMVANPHNDRVEQDALIEILERGRAPLFLFDELNRNVAWANCEFEMRAQDVRELIGCLRTLYAGALNQNVSKALDNIEEAFRPAVQVEGATRIPVVPVRLALSDFHFAELVGVSQEGDIHRFSIIDAEEGHGLEQSIWQLIDSLFLGNTFRSPQVTSGTKLRELTDVLALTDTGVFLFESKACGVLSASPSRTTTRRAKSLEGQILKAIDQLVGAVKSLKNGERISSSSGKEIGINRIIPPHGIVLVSEMYPFGDWSMISRELILASLKCGAMMHILDLSELLVMVGNSATADHLDDYLMKRFAILVDTENALFRVRFRPSQPGS